MTFFFFLVLLLVTAECVISGLFLLRDKTWCVGRISLPVIMVQIKVDLQDFSFTCLLAEIYNHTKYNHLLFFSAPYFIIPRMHHLACALASENR